MTDRSEGADAPEITLETVDGKPMALSVDVARHFGKLHKNVLRDIEALACSKDFCRLNFEPTSREVRGPNGGGRMERAIRMTRDGFTMLVMGFTGPKAARFKEAYIAAFNRMAEALAGGAGPARPGVSRERAEAIWNTPSPLYGGFSPAQMHDLASAGRRPRERGRALNREAHALAMGQFGPIRAALEGQGLPGGAPETEGAELPAGRGWLNVGGRLVLLDLVTVPRPGDIAATISGHLPLALRQVVSTEGWTGQGRVVSVASEGGGGFPGVMPAAVVGIVLGFMPAGDGA